MKYLRPFNILCVGDKSPIQRGFFNNSAGNLLPALSFLGELYNFCNFLIIFSGVMVIRRRATYLTDSEMIKYYPKYVRLK